MQDTAFSNEVVMITGAVGNLGRAAAMRFRQLGARLVLLDRGRDRLTQAFQELVGSPDHFLASGVDVGEPASVADAVERALSRFGRIDALVNTVGAFRGGKAVDQTDPTDWTAMFEANVSSTVNTCRAVAPVMRRQRRGKMVSVASVAALHGGAGIAAYCAAKSAVLRLTECLSAELRGDGINVNCILPTTLDTRQNREAMPSADTRDWVRTEDAAAVIAFLCSAAGRAIHGAAIPLTGVGN